MGVEIDLVGGTSMGAVVGGVYTYEAEYDEMLSIATSLGSNKLIFDRTLPIVALNRSRNVTSIYHKTFLDRQIEDAWRPFYCMASNLTKAQAIPIEAGGLALAVRASSAIPAVFTPIIWEGGDVLVDGGLMNNFPVDIMREKVETGIVIGVNVSPSTIKTRNYEIGTDVSGWEILMRRVNPLAKKRRVPSLVGTLMRSLDVNHLDQIRNTQTLADLVIELDLGDFHSMNFDRHTEIIETSYQSARTQIEEWLQARGTSVAAVLKPG